MKNIAKYSSGNQLLTISAISGKRGVNVKATLKIGKEKAQTGCRETYKDDKTAQKAFDKLCSESESRGWNKKTTSSRTAFTTIPDAPKGKK